MGDPRPPKDDTSNAVERAVEKQALQRRPAPSAERWNLNDYVEVALELDAIKPETAAQLRIAKDFRNLIHPGRAIRLEQKCDRGTAHAAAAGLYFTVRDLERAR